MSMRCNEPPPITAPYLICLNIPCYRDDRGRRYFDPMWHKDLVQHTRYLSNLTLACPLRPGAPPADAVEWAAPLPEIHFVDLPMPNGVAGAIARLPSTAIRLWKAVGNAAIVHLGAAGWPIPLGWVASPLAAIRGKLSVIVVESAPWRCRPGLHAPLKKRLRADLSEWLCAWSVNHASLFVATQHEYLALLKSGTQSSRDGERGHVIHASWLDEEIVLSQNGACESWQSKRRTSGDPLKLVFAGRLEAAKGVHLLLDAMRLLGEENIPVELDMLGRGSLLGECNRASQDLQGQTKVRVLGTVPYDSDFFGALRRHHALVSPSLSDEQPRVVYDAFSQAVPVLAGDTPGLKDCVADGTRGMFVAKNDAASWADLIKKCVQSSDVLETMGKNALEYACRATHSEMHRKRRILLAEMLERKGMHRAS